METPSTETGSWISSEQRGELEKALQPLVEQLRKQAGEAVDAQLETLREKMKERAAELTERVRAALEPKAEEKEPEPPKATQEKPEAPTAAPRTGPSSRFVPTRPRTHR